MNSENNNLFFSIVEKIIYALAAIASLVIMFPFLLIATILAAIPILFICMLLFPQSYILPAALILTVIFIIFAIINNWNATR
ncbi:MAG TPA: hypothetical protein OIM03_09450 [Veillonellaceae bacterium]|nr:hypothetical protein [Veillonellaceae bacterium]